MNRAISVGVALMALVALTAPVMAAQRPLVLEFEKQWAGPGYYRGTIDGGGEIQMWLSDSEVLGNTQHFTADVAVIGSSAGSFTAVVSGQINFSTGRVVLNGIVTSGALDGAQVQEESQLVDPNIGSFVGTIQIMPAS